MDHRAGYFLAFLFLLCGAARLARFNVQTNPVPKNPGRPDRKYFVGLPIPAAAGLVAAIVYANDSVPVEWWILSALWLARARPARVPDGQHLALSKLQGDSPHRSAVATHSHPVRRANRSDLDLFPASPAGTLHRVCQPPVS